MLRRHILVLLQRKPLDNWEVYLLFLFLLLNDIRWWIATNYSPVAHGHSLKRVLMRFSVWLNCMTLLTTGTTSMVNRHACKKLSFYIRVPLGLDNFGRLPSAAYFPSQGWVVCLRSIAHSVLSFQLGHFLAVYASNSTAPLLITIVVFEHLMSMNTLMNLLCEFSKVKALPTTYKFLISTVYCRRFLDLIIFSRKVMFGLTVACGHCPDDMRTPGSLSSRFWRREPKWPGRDVPG